MKPKVFGGAFTGTITLIALYVGIMDKQVWPEGCKIENRD